MSRMLSGHPQDFKLPPAPKPQGPWIVSAAATNTAWSGPWGVSFTANLTPDKETGLGKWTQRNFSETIRTGRHMGRGRADPAADADPDVQALHRRGPRGDLRLPAVDPADPQPGARAAAAGLAEMGTDPIFLIYSLIYSMRARATMAWMPLLPSTTWVTRRSQARLQKT